MQHHHRLIHARASEIATIATLLICSLVLGFGTIGCTGDENADLDAGLVDTGPEVETPPDFCRAPAPPQVSTAMQLERVFEHAFPEDDDATRITQIVPSPFLAGEWYAVKHKGWIIRFNADPDQPGHDIVLDLRDGRVSVDNDEAGIVSMAFHPSGEYVFLGYQAPTATTAFFDSVITRFDVNDDGSFDPDSEIEFLRLPQPNFPHSLTHIVFGPDGYLYATFGDGGTVAARPNAQDTTNFYGSMIRIDVDEDDDERGTQYAIPDDNPVIDDDAAPELFAYGLRNTWRFSFDSATGTIWGGDVGETGFEEVNRIEAGNNYGWPILEGPECFGAETCDTDGITLPTASYTRDQGISITGGFVYRGGNVPALLGRYVYADYISGMIWSLDAADDAVDTSPRVEAQADFWIVSMAESPDGEVYVVRWSQERHFDSTGPGGIYRLVPAPVEGGADNFPTLLSQTGCMDEDDITQPASGLRLYVPAARLWSDGADKLRYLSLPTDASIDIDNEGNLLFPEGTVLVKHFLFDGRIHETRLYIHHAEVGWRGYTYRWREDGSDAELLGTGMDETLSNDVFWRYPSRNQCANCHTAAAGILLGLEVGQLTQTARSPAPQWREWYVDGLFVRDVTIEQLEAFADYAGIASDADLETRARSYLHSNCSGCHRPGGPPQSQLDLRFTTPLTDANLCDALPINGTLGSDDPDSMRLLAPGDPAQSILYLRLTDHGDNRMPPLATEVVHEDAADVVRDWIESIESCE